MNFKDTYLALALLLFASTATVPAASETTDNAVILLYHHVSDTMPPSTSVSPEVFEQHLAYLSSGFTVIPLERAIETLRNGGLLPDKAVVITFDDGYRNIYDNAHPLLLKYGFPYTVFINPPLIGSAAYQLNWAQVREMEAGGARFANHTMRHDHLLQRRDSETDDQWLERVEQDFLRAEGMLEENLGYSLRYVAYPYGEFDSAIQKMVARLGFVGFGQHSGGVASGSDFTALPRFPAAGIYANLNSLKVKMNSLALPVTGTSVEDPVRGDPQARLAFSFTFDSEDLRVSQFNCFFGNELQELSAQGDTVEVMLQSRLPVGRSRVNCTAPSKTRKGRYYWYSQPFFVPAADGSYPD